MPEPLVCEDSDLERLLQTVNSQPGARILYQDTVRRGGVLGFFAREVHRIAYVHSDLTEPSDETSAVGHPATVTFTAAPVVAAATATGIPVASSFESALRLFEDSTAALGGPGLADGPTEEGSGLDHLLASADALESSANTPGATTTPVGAPTAGVDFAELLHRLTTEGVELQSSTEAEPATGNQTPSRPPIARAVPATPDRTATPQPAPASRAGRPDAQARLDMLLQLRELGVPVSVNPRSDTRDVYQALESILLDLPAAVEPPRRAGEVLAIVGESTAAVRAARTLAITLRIPENSIGIAGLPAESATVLDHAYVSGPHEATRLHRELGQADTPSIVVIATDAAGGNPDDPWAREMITALAPSACWAVVDARWKAADSQALLARLGRVDALVVHSAELSTSPASVWDLDLPLGLLDGRAPSAVAWTGLLFRLLATDDARHRASA